MPKESIPETAGRTAVLFVVVLSSFLAPFMMSAVNVALHVIGEHFALDAVALGWVVTAHILACAVFMLPCGRAGDIWGRKKIFLGGMIVYSAGSLLSFDKLRTGRGGRLISRPSLCLVNR